MFDAIGEAVELELLFRDSRMSLHEFCSLLPQLHRAPGSAGRRKFIHDLRDALQAKAYQAALAK
jgi:hypothetical protein